MGKAHLVKPFGQYIQELLVSNSASGKHVPAYLDEIIYIRGLNQVIIGSKLQANFFETTGPGSAPDYFWNSAIAGVIF